MNAGTSSPLALTTSGSPAVKRRVFTTTEAPASVGQSVRTPPSGGSTPPSSAPPSGPASSGSAVSEPWSVMTPARRKTPEPAPSRLQIRTMQPLRANSMHGLGVLAATSRNEACAREAKRSGMPEVDTRWVSVTSPRRSGPKVPPSTTRGGPASMGRRPASAAGTGGAHADTTPRRHTTRSTGAMYTMTVGSGDAAPGRDRWADQAPRLHDGPRRRAALPGRVRRRLWRHRIEAALRLDEAYRSGWTARCRAHLKQFSKNRGF
jgi:hypothetical protein